MITAVIPAYNESERIQSVLEETSRYVAEILVIDDKSTDATADIARTYGKVVTNDSHMGYIHSLKRGFKEATHDIIVTLDGDGEHHPRDIPRLVQPIRTCEADLVLGVRERIPRLSERIINFLTTLRVDVKDCGTGFRAIKRDLAKKLELKGMCTCGIFVLEALSYGATLKTVPITTRNIDKKKRIALCHFKQIMLVLKWVLRGKTRT
jgi:glycosyltransferase involved in cell wall biosynthesis